MQRWHSKTHSPESWDCGSSASNETHRWCMTRRVSEHPPPKCHLEASSAAFFHASPQLLWIQFKCKATEDTRRLCLPRMYSICSWALGWRCLGPSPGPTHHTDRSIGSDWLLDPLGADLMRMDHPFLLSSNILPTSFSLFSLLLWFSVVELWPRRMSLLSLLSHNSNTLLCLGRLNGQKAYSNSIIKRPLGGIYCPDNGLAVFSNGWLTSCWCIGNDLNGHMRFP